MSTSKRMLEAVVLLVALSAIPAYAEENIGFRVKTGINYVDYSMPGGFTSLALSGSLVPVQQDYNVTMRSKYMASVLGVAYVSPEGGFYDVTVRRSAGNTTWNSQEALGSVYGYANTAPDQGASRVEYTLTLGTAITETLQLFGGYQSSYYEVNATTMNSTHAIPTATSVLRFKNSVAMSGFFSGLSKSFRIGGGAFSINGSFSLMSAYVENETTDPTTTPGPGVTIKSTKQYSNGVGYGLGAAYAYPLGSTFSLVTEVKYHSYQPRGYVQADKSKSVGMNLVSSF